MMLVITCSQLEILLGYRLYNAICTHAHTFNLDICEIRMYTKSKIAGQCPWGSCPCHKIQTWIIIQWKCDNDCKNKLVSQKNRLCCSMRIITGRILYIFVILTSFKVWQRSVTRCWIWQHLYTKRDTVWKSNFSIHNMDLPCNHDISDLCQTCSWRPTCKKWEYYHTLIIHISMHLVTRHSPWTKDIVFCSHSWNLSNGPCGLRFPNIKLL